MLVLEIGSNDDLLHKVQKHDQVQRASAEHVATQLPAGELAMEPAVAIHLRPRVEMKGDKIGVGLVSTRRDHGERLYIYRAGVIFFFPPFLRSSRSPPPPLCSPSTHLRPIFHRSSVRHHPSF